MGEVVAEGDARRGGLDQLAGDAFEHWGLSGHDLCEGYSTAKRKRISQGSDEVGEIRREIRIEADILRLGKLGRSMLRPYKDICACVWSYFFAAATFAAASAYFFVKRSTRPAVSISFCLPVKKGWQLEQISTLSMSPLMVERVEKLWPQAQWTVTA